MVRAFVALELSGDMREQLAKAQNVLRECTSRLTFVDPAIIHITVKFLGDVDERKIPPVKEALSTIRADPFPVTGRMITVNDPRRPRTVWCTIDDDGRSRQLFMHMEDVLEPIGFAREKRPFTPHATVARVKYADPSLFRQLELLKETAYGSCMITGMKLKKSTLTGSGPVYEDLLEVMW
jgi:2'-5' RNA ligase